MRPAPFGKRAELLFSTYAGVCISNCIVSAFRRAFSRSGQIMKEAVPLDRKADLAAIQDPESQLIDRENLDVLLHKIRNTLTRMEQQVLSCYVSGFSYQEISSALGISVKSVGNAMQRGAQKAAECRLTAGSNPLLYAPVA